MTEPYQPSEEERRAHARELREETGAATGDVRENDPRDAGFSDEVDRLFRSHFQRVNRLADLSYEHVRPAYRAGYAAATDPAHAGRSFDDIETVIENGWLSVRSGDGDWASVRELAQAGFEQAQTQGRIIETTLPDSSDRPSYSNPVADS